MDLGPSLEREREREEWGLGTVQVGREMHAFCLLYMIGIDWVVQTSLESSLFQSHNWDSTEPSQNQNT